MNLKSLLTSGTYIAVKMAPTREIKENTKKVQSFRVLASTGNTQPTKKLHSQFKPIAADAAALTPFVGTSSEIIRKGIGPRPMAKLATNK